MTDAWEDAIGRPESYQEALSRSLVAAPKAAMTEQEQAEKIIAARERMKSHDEFYRHDYIQGTEAMLVSRALAKQYAYFINEPDDDRPGGDD